MTQPGGEDATRPELPPTLETTSEEAHGPRALDPEAIASEPSEGEEAETPAGPEDPPPSKTMQRVMRWLSIAMTAAIVVLCIAGWRHGLFTSLEKLQAMVERLGVAGPIFFILLQITQVVIPFIPGGITLGAGVLIFGPWLGWVYNYIGICLGSLAIFALMRAFGRPLALRIIGEATMSKYGKWLNDEKRFGRLFALAIFFPIAPDDALCYLAGMTTMSWKRYTLIILLGKPMSIALYSFGLTTLFRWVALFQRGLGQ